MKLFETDSQEFSAGPNSKSVLVLLNCDSNVAEKFIKKMEYRSAFKENFQNPCIDVENTPENIKVVILVEFESVEAAQKAVAVIQKDKKIARAKLMEIEYLDGEKFLNYFNETRLERHNKYWENKAEQRKTPYFWMTPVSLVKGEHDVASDTLSGGEETLVEGIVTNTLMMMQALNVDLNGSFYDKETGYKWMTDLSNELKLLVQKSEDKINASELQDKIISHMDNMRDEYRKSTLPLRVKPYAPRKSVPYIHKVEA